MYQIFTYTKKQFSIKRLGKKIWTSSNNFRDRNEDNNVNTETLKDSQFLNFDTINIRRLIRKNSG